MFYRKATFEKCARSTGKNLCRSLFLMKLENGDLQFYQHEAPAQVLRNTFVIKAPVCLLLWIRCNICIFKKGFIFMQSCIQNLVQHLTWRVFAKIANGFQFWTILPSSILDNWRCPEYASGPCKYVQMTFTWFIWSCLWNCILWCSLLLVDSQFKRELFVKSNHGLRLFEVRA